MAIFTIQNITTMKNNLLLVAAMLCGSASFGQSWLLGGNAATNPATHFIGTTDAMPLSFKVAGIRSGYLDTVKKNTSFGFRTLMSSAGDVNTAFGYNVLSANTSGAWNTGVGALALLVNKTGDFNTAIGGGSLWQNASGGQNTATGAFSMFSNLSGQFNAAFGYEALSNNFSASNNAAFGSEVLRNNNGAGNTAMGSRALSLNSSGNSNVAVGVNALYNSTTASNLVAIGDSALHRNTGVGNSAIGSKAAWQNTSGTFNTATGFQSLYSNEQGGSNSVFGSQSLYRNTTGSLNTSIGLAALYNSNGASNTCVGGYSNYYNTNGGYNTAVGVYALIGNNTGSNNTALGYFADVSAGAYTNATAIGASSKATASNQVRIGNIYVSSIGGYQPWTNLSDGRFKKDIKENVPGLAFINKLRPVTYHVDITGINKHLNKNRVADKNLPAPPPQDEAAIAAQEKVLATGFVAQEVESAAKETGFDFDGVDKPKNKDDFYGLRYSEFVVPLVKAVQELSKQNDELKNEIAEIKKLLTNKTATEGTIKTTINNQALAKLGQNIPNPADHSTIIPFSIPQGCNNASINIIETATGRVLRSVAINCNQTQLKLDAGQLPAGTYSYALYVDGKIIASKQMVIAKATN